MGPLSATALVATVGNAQNFRNGRALSAWLGLVPAHHKSGNREVMLGISKRGAPCAECAAVRHWSALSGIRRNCPYDMQASIDEPAAGVDASGQEALNAVLRRLQEEETVTTLLISHDLSVVYQYASNVLCLARQRACIGPPMRF